MALLLLMSVRFSWLKEEPFQGHFAVFEMMVVDIDMLSHNKTVLTSIIFLHVPGPHVSPVCFQYKAEVKPQHWVQEVG